MRGTVYPRCGCPRARDEAGNLIRDEAGRVLREHRKGCKPKWGYVFDAGRRGDGRRRQETKSGFRTRREADRALTEALDAHDKGTFVSTGRLTIGDYLHEWLAGRASLKPT